MLFRHAVTPERHLDPDVFLTMGSHAAPAASDEPVTNDYNNNNNSNTLDDVWGDADDAAAHPHPHHPDSYYYPHPHPHPHPHPYPHSHHHDQQPHPSDIPRLRAAHATAGYRDGVAAAKARTAQPGFDEGYGLGATLGARAGQLLGVLEGLAAAAGLHALSLSCRLAPPGSGGDGSWSGSGSGSGSQFRREGGEEGGLREEEKRGGGRRLGGGYGNGDGGGVGEEREMERGTAGGSGNGNGNGREWQAKQAGREAERLSGLLTEARRELSVRGGIFGGEYFSEADATWRYSVGGGGGAGGPSAVGFDTAGTDDGSGSVVFADVAAAHPLVKKWDRIVRAEAERYGVDWDVLEGEGEGGHDGGGDGEEGDEDGDGGQRGERARRERESKPPAVRAGGPLAW